MKRIPLLLAVILAASLVNAQEDPPLITDRPDQTESALVVPAWLLQIETGMLKEWVNNPDDSFDKNIRYGTTLLRYGLFDFMEFRLGSDLLNHRFKLPAEAERSDFGVSPIGVGFKFALAKENGLIPDIALITGWQIPNTGNRIFSSDKWQHSFVFAFAHTLSQRWGLGYNLGYEFEGGFDKSAFKYSLVGGYAIADRWGAFIEAYGAKLSNIPWDVRTDAGVTFLLFPNFQLDLSGGIGLTDVSAIGFLSGGFSWRIPN
jgi:hypothetical protein